MLAMDVGRGCAARSNVLRGLLFLALGYDVAGCGGGSGGVASAPGPSTQPPPPPPEPQTTFETIVGDSLGPAPALTSGTYDTIALVETSPDATHALAYGTVQLAVDAETNTYTVTFDPARLPEGASWRSDVEGQLEFTIDDPTYGHEFDTITRTDGKVVEEAHGERRFGSISGAYVFDEPAFTMVVGKSHVSLGQWTWPLLTTNAAGQVSTGDTPFGSVVFVYGDRTPAGSIPVSGTATYRLAGGNDWVASQVDGPDSYGPKFLDFALQADFAARSMGAEVSYVADFSNGDAYLTELDGSAPIGGDGIFDIVLNGLRSFGKVEDESFVTNDLPFDSPSGSLAGALFGPNAEQIGATVALPGYTDNETFVLAFAAAKE